MTPISSSFLSLRAPNGYRQLDSCRWYKKQDVIWLTGVVNSDTPDSRRIVSLLLTESLSTWLLVVIPGSPTDYPSEWGWEPWTPTRETLERVFLIVWNELTASRLNLTRPAAEIGRLASYISELYTKPNKIQYPGQTCISVLSCWSSTGPDTINSSWAAATQLLRVWNWDDYDDEEYYFRWNPECGSKEVSLLSLEGHTLQSFRTYVYQLGYTYSITLLSVVQRGDWFPSTSPGVLSPYQQRGLAGVVGQVGGSLATLIVDPDDVRGQLAVASAGRELTAPLPHISYRAYSPPSGVHAWLAPDLDDSLRLEGWSGALSAMQDLVFAWTESRTRRASRLGSRNSESVGRPPESMLWKLLVKLDQGDELTALFSDDGVTYETRTERCLAVDPLVSEWWIPSPAVRPSDCYVIVAVESAQGSLMYKARRATWADIMPQEVALLQALKKAVDLEHYDVCPAKYAWPVWWDGVKLVLCTGEDIEFCVGSSGLERVSLQDLPASPFMHVPAPEAWAGDSAYWGSTSSPLPWPSTPINDYMVAPGAARPSDAVRETVMAPVLGCLIQGLQASINSAGTLVFGRVRADSLEYQCGWTACDGNYYSLSLTNETDEISIYSSGQSSYKRDPRRRE